MLCECDAFFIVCMLKPGMSVSTLAGKPITVHLPQGEIYEQLVPERRKTPTLRVSEQGSTATNPEYVKRVVRVRKIVSIA